MEVIGSHRQRLAGRRETWVQVVDQVIAARRAIAIIEGRIRQALEQLPDRCNARLCRVGALHIDAAALSVVAEAIVRARLRVRIANLAQRRNGRLPAFGVIGRIGAGQGEIIGGGPAHHRLVVVVGQRIVVCEAAEIRQITGR